MSWASPPDSYWQPPEHTIADEMEEAEDQAEQLVEEWAELAHIDIGVSVFPSKYATDVVWHIDYVESNGVQYQVDQDFDTYEQTRAFIEKSWPIPDEYPDDKTGERP